MDVPRESRFEAFFSDFVYRLYKNHLYNFRLRRWAVHRAIQKKDFRNLLEIGCGISPMLAVSKPAIQTDVSWQALRFLRKGLGEQGPSRIVVCEASRLPFREGSVDGIVCSEVLEHIENDLEVVREMKRVLAREGELVLTCPMRPECFGFDDQFVGHLRRYELSQLRRQLSENGLEALEVSSVLGFLEKWWMEKLTRVFSLLKRGEKEGRSHEILGILAVAFLPFYVVFNYLMAILVGCEARLTPVEKAVTVLIRCRKRS